MHNIYQPPNSDIAGDSPSDNSVRYGLLALVAFVGFPLFQFIAWVFVPTANRFLADISLKLISAERDGLILFFDLVHMAILYWLACVVSIRFTNVNVWAFSVIFGLASGAVILAAKGWVLIAPEYAFPVWYELTSVFLGLTVSVAYAIHLRKMRAAQ